MRSPPPRRIQKRRHHQPARLAHLNARGSASTQAKIYPTLHGWRYTLHPEFVPFASPQFIRPDLFQRLYDIVASFEDDYVMHIISDFDEIPEFEPLISKHRFVARMTDRSQLSKTYERSA